MSRTLHLPGLRAASGSPRIVALHCSGSSGRQWAGYASHWGSRFNAPDLLGYGAESWTAGRPVTLDEEAAHVARRMGQGPVHLVGHSYGAAVALQLALRCPARVSGLTLFEPVCFQLLRSGADTAAWYEISRVARRVSTLALAGMRSPAAARFVDYWSGAGAWKAMSASRQLALAERMPKIAAEFGALFGATPDARAYAALRMPVRLVSGTESPRPARRVVQCLRTCLPSAEHIELPGVGHMGPLTHAEAFAVLLPAPQAQAPMPLAA